MIWLAVRLLGCGVAVVWGSMPVLAAVERFMADPVLGWFAAAFMAVWLLLVVPLAWMWLYRLSGGRV